MSVLGAGISLAAAIRYLDSMKMALDTGTASYRIRSYADGHVVVNEEILTRSLVITPEQLLRDWPPRTVDEVRAEHFEDIVALRPEVLLLGMGARLIFPPPARLEPLYAAGIGVEVMDTGAACRTFNILAAEGRAVAAALLMI